MNDNPLITVILTTYNESISIIKESMLSIINQTYKNIELIVINDNPNNSKIIEKTIDTICDKRINLINNISNIGLYESLNKALKIANGEYIARMDADDISLPQRLEKELNYLINKKLDLVSSNISHYLEGKLTYTTNYPLHNKYISFAYRIGYYCTAHPTWLAKKQVFIDLNGYRTLLTHSMDLDFILRAIKARKTIGNIKEPLLLYRIRKESITHSLNEYEQRVICEYLSNNIDRINEITHQELTNYVNSKTYINNVRQKEYFVTTKNLIKTEKIYLLVKLITNKYLYKFIIIKLFDIYIHFIDNYSKN